MRTMTHFVSYAMECVLLFLSSLCSRITIYEDCSLFLYPIMLQHCLLYILSQPLSRNEPSKRLKVAWMSDADSSDLLSSFYHLHPAAHGKTLYTQRFKN